MKIKINLLQETQEIRTRLRRIGILLQSASVVVLIIFGVGVFGIFSYSLILSRQQANTLEKIERTKEQIEGLKSTEVKQVLVKNRLENISGVIDNYGIEYGLMTDLYRFLLNKVSFDQISYNDSEGILSFELTAGDVIRTVDFMEQIAGYAQDNNFSKVSVSGFNRNDAGNYSMRVTMNF